MATGFLHLATFAIFAAAQMAASASPHRHAAPKVALQSPAPHGQAPPVLERIDCTVHCALRHVPEVRAQCGGWVPVAIRLEDGIETRCLAVPQLERMLRAQEAAGGAGAGWENAVHEPVHRYAKFGAQGADGDAEELKLLESVRELQLGTDNFLQYNPLTGDASAGITGEHRFSGRTTVFPFHSRLEVASKGGLGTEIERRGLGIGKIKHELSVDTSADIGHVVYRPTTAGKRK